MTISDPQCPAANPYAPPALHPQPWQPQRDDDVAVRNGPRGIGGWLLLPLLHLVVTAVRGLASLALDHAPMYVAGGDWWTIIDPHFDDYHPLWGPLIVFETTATVAFVIAAATALWLMFRRSITFPRVMIGFYLTNAVYALLEYVGCMVVPALASATGARATQQLVGAFIGCLIWVSYMHASKRVANTFTRRWRQPLQG
ncbi:MAG TPA: DUF2569 domain-containing protein [Sorangium sp.]|nr:DUF2569 domain-containing protein [Sorangium sp.]